MIESARVSVTNSSGQVLILPHVGKGRYGAALLPLEGRNSIDEPLFEHGPAPVAGEAYELRVEAPGFETVTARSRAPERISAEVELISGWTVISVPASATNARLRVTTGSVVSQLYELRAVTNREGVADFIAGAEFQTSLDIIEEASFWEELRNPDAANVYSRAFAMSETEFEATVLFPGAIIVGMYIRSVSDEYFYFRRSQEQRRAADRNPFLDTPRLYSNIERGVGVFAGTTLSRATLGRAN